VLTRFAGKHVDRAPDTGVADRGMDADDESIFLPGAEELGRDLDGEGPVREVTRRVAVVGAGMTRFVRRALETGKGTRPKVVKFQLRPDPLAR
jgi:hypothetical protein